MNTEPRDAWQDRVETAWQQVATVDASAPPPSAADPLPPHSIRGFLRDNWSWILVPALLVVLGVIAYALVSFAGGESALPFDYVIQ